MDLFTIAAVLITLAASPERDLISAITYIIVVFSILVQGLTLSGVIKRIAA